MPMETMLRLGLFFSVFAIVALWEWRQPRRQRRYNRSARWLWNIGLSIFDILLVRLLLPAGALTFAIVAERNQLGMLNSMQAPPWFALIVSVLVLDFAIYWQHRLMHAVPWLWRLHRVHHADPDFDVTTGIRFHPIEILFSLGIKAVVILILGASIWSVLIFELVLSLSSLFTHANAGFQHRLDTFLRILFVTPDMHRIHHSVDEEETDSNFGFNISLWDRLFNTYKAHSKKPQQTFTIGIGAFDQIADQRLDKLLTQPWRK